MANSIPSGRVETIIVACEAGMGSSVMSVNALKKKLKAAKLDKVTVMHKPARAVTDGAYVVLVHRGLANVVRKQAPNAVVIAFDQFFNDPVFDTLVQTLAAGADIAEKV